ncbi:MAG: patatin-like phospholipase family protein [Vicinamibacterales bacterium]
MNARYSPERRTALVLCGTGAHGAYHAGVLRALHEAGVKIDVMAGQGVGAAGAALAAVDGASRLWDEKGVWRGATARTLYGWKWPLRLAGWLACLLVAVLVMPLLLAVLDRDVDPLPWLVAAALILAAVLLAIVAGGRVMDRRVPARRSVDGGPWWQVLGAPLDAERARQAFAGALWELLHGGSQAAPPPHAAIGRRYAEVLAESVGQPGFRELMIVTTDLDSRRDVVAALLCEPFRRGFAAPRPGEERRSEAIDLAGTDRDHAFDVIAAALTPPVACDPHLVTFGIDGYWRGETHRLCDRPGACVRLVEELADAGVTQAIIVSAVAAPCVPHRLAAVRLEPRHRLSEFLAAAESAALRDARAMARFRFDAVYVIGPAHNPIGAFDLAGAYDKASDRRPDLTELMNRAYEDTYREFIEPVVAASGEQLAHAGSRGVDLPS